MATNPILEELRTVRDRLLAESGGTLDALVNRLQAEEKKSDRPHFVARQTDDSAVRPTPTKSGTGSSE